MSWQKHWVGPEAQLISLVVQRENDKLRRPLKLKNSDRDTSMECDTKALPSKKHKLEALVQLEHSP